MNEQELKKYLNDIVSETKNAEMKVSLDSKDWVGWAKSFCAFSNGAGGHVFVGVDSRMNLAPIPKEDVDGVVLRANSVLKQHTKPFVDYDMRPIAVDGGGVVLDFAVSPRDRNLTWLVQDGASPVLFVRHYGSSEAATLEETLLLLKRIKKNEYDSEAVGIDLRSLSFSGVSAKLSGYPSPLRPADLQSLGLSNGRGKSTLTGWLFADGSDCPESRVRCLTWSGQTRSSDCLDDKTFAGGLLEVLAKAVGYVWSCQNYRFSSRKSPNSLEGYASGSFALKPVREALVNSLAHRDYAIAGNPVTVECFPDRIEVTSPGFSLSYPDGVGRRPLAEIASLRRNESVSRVFHECGLMEGWGSGFADIIKDYDGLGSEYAPLFYGTPVSFTIVLMNKKFGNHFIAAGPSAGFEAPAGGDYFLSREKLFASSPSLQSIESAIRSDFRASIDEIAAATGLSRAGVKYNLARMKFDCLIRRKGSKRSGVYDIIPESDRPADFLSLDYDERELLLSWMGERYQKAQKKGDVVLSSSMVDAYMAETKKAISSGQIKGAILASRFSVSNLEDDDWKVLALEIRFDRNALNNQ